MSIETGQTEKSEQTAKNECLIIVDAQLGFLTKETLEVGTKLLDLLNEYQGMLTISTQFVNFDDSAFEKYLNWDNMKDNFEIEVLGHVKDRSDFVIKKYGCYGCSDDIKRILVSKGITKAYIAGFDTDACVLKTAMDLFDSGIQPVILAKYCASTGGVDYHLAALNILERNLGKDQVLRD